MANESASINVCRTIELDFSQCQRPHMRDVTVQSFSDKKVQCQKYLKLVTPGKKVVSMGRKEMLAINHDYAPTSLFFQTVHACFARHYPLALRPEVLMHLIVHEIATTIKLYPEAYRHLFTTEQGKGRIDVRHDGLVKGDPDSPWHEAIELFRPELAKRVPSQVMKLILPAFSTHTVESECASLVAFMDAASPYYDYHTHTMCGIPQIRLLGQPADYTAMREAAQKLAPLFQEHLALYFEHLIPVLEKLEAQAHGEALDEEFWFSIYKYASASGTSVFNGWLTAFVNYVQNRKGKGDKYVAKNPKAYDWTRCEEGGSWCGLVGLELGSLPSQVSLAPFTWHYFGEEVAMHYAGGVLGIDNEDGYVTPALSYAILEG